MDFKKLKELLENQGKEKDLSQYIKTYDDLKKRKELRVKVDSGEDWGELNRIKGFGLALRQVLHHRAINLYEGSLQALMQNNVYLVALAVRGHYETTAAIGHLHSRLYSFSQKNIEAETIDKEIYRQLIASKEQRFEGAPEPKNILNLIDYADQAVSKHILGDNKGSHKMLRDQYDFLCEFCHPNFHSNALSYDLDKTNSEFAFKYNIEQIEKREFLVAESILISSPLFIELFDGVGKILNDL